MPAALPMLPGPDYSSGPHPSTRPFPPAVNLDMREPMPHTNSSIVRLACPPLVTRGCGCGRRLAPPSAPPGQESLALTKAGGDGQTRAVGEPLDLLVVKV